MIEKVYDVVVIGGGAAGMACSVRLGEKEINVALIEREEYLGGILQQCIHNGFGLHYFKEELTGPEFAEKFSKKVENNKNIDVYLKTTVVKIDTYNNLHQIFAYSSKYGVLNFKTKAIALAMGCRERNRGNIGIPGTRPAGILTAGLAQRLINMEGVIPGKDVVIVGSGDIGLIMARRLTWVGARVHAVVEIRPYPSGLTRNIVQCLNDYNIPLYLSHIVSQIYGNERIEAVDITPIIDGKPDYEKTFKIKCDTLLLSVGLIPDTQLIENMEVKINPETNGAYIDANLMTSVNGIFACGNVLHVHDLVDFVAYESERCADFIYDYLHDKHSKIQYSVQAGANLKYVIPNKYSPERENLFYMRSMIVKNKAKLKIKLNGNVIKQKTLMHVQPSEMISIKLNEKDFKNKIDKILDNKLEFSLE